MTCPRSKAGSGPDNGDRGTFEFRDGPASATLDLKANTLRSDVPFTIKRASDPCCINNNETNEQAACIEWNLFFDLCGLLGTYPGCGPQSTRLTEFTVSADDWWVAQYGFRRRLGFSFTIKPADIGDHQSIDLKAGMTLMSADCLDETCGGLPPLFPTEVGESTEFVVELARIHLKSKKGVAHAAECHEQTGYPLNNVSLVVIKRLN